MQRKYLIPLSPKNSALIASQSEKWRRHQLTAVSLSAIERPFITVSRQYGCGAYPLAEALAEKLTSLNPEQDPWVVYDRELVTKVSRDHRLSHELVDSLSQKLRTELEESLLSLFKGFASEIKIFRSTASTIKALAMHGRVIIVGRGGAILTADLPAGLHIRLVAPEKWRVERTMKIFGMSSADARKFVRKMDRERESFIEKYLNEQVGNPLHYHMIFNNALTENNTIVEAVISALKTASKYKVKS
jgi:cytidylate kinase